jgi:hypothetical protein
MLTPNDDRSDDVVDITNPTNVRYWSQSLLVTDAALRALVSIHGPRVADLRAAVEQATKTETSKLFPKP